MTQRDVARAMDWSRSKVLRIESGSVVVSTNDLRALLDHYGVDDAKTVSDLIAVAKSSRKHWAGPGDQADTPDPLSTAYFAREASASAIRQFEPLLVPGPLQTEEYMRAEIAGTRMYEGPQLERSVQTRRERLGLLSRADGPEMFFILDEAVLRREVGSRHVMSRQLEHLADLSSRPNISIQIVPLARGAYTGLLGPFVVLEFRDAQSQLYLQIRDGVVLRNDTDEVCGHLDHFQQMQHKLATDPDRLGDVLAWIASS